MAGVASSSVKEPALDGRKDKDRPKCATPVVALPTLATLTLTLTRSRPPPPTEWRTLHLKSYPLTLPYPFLKHPPPFLLLGSLHLHGQGGKALPKPTLDLNPKPTVP